MTFSFPMRLLYVALCQLPAAAWTRLPTFRSMIGCTVPSQHCIARSCQLSMCGRANELKELLRLVADKTEREEILLSQSLSAIESHFRVIPRPFSVGQVINAAGENLISAKILCAAATRPLRDMMGHKPHVCASCLQVGRTATRPVVGRYSVAIWGNLSGIYAKGSAIR